MPSNCLRGNPAWRIAKQTGIFFTVILQKEPAKNLHTSQPSPDADQLRELFASNLVHALLDVRHNFVPILFGRRSSRRLSHGQ